MYRFRIEKLVRDKVPQRMRERLEDPHCRILSDEEYIKALKAKLLEESIEVQESSSEEELAEEIADVFEVLEALAAVHKIDLEQVRQFQQSKREKRGGFNDKIYCVHVDSPATSSLLDYYLSKPDIYPPIDK